MPRRLSPETLALGQPVPTWRELPRAGFVPTRDTGEPAPTLFLAAKRGDLTLYTFHRQAYWDLKEIRAFIKSRPKRLGRRKKS